MLRRLSDAEAANRDWPESRRGRASCVEKGCKNGMQNWTAMTLALGRSAQDPAEGLR